MYAEFWINSHNFYQGITTSGCLHNANQKADFTG